MSSLKTLLGTPQNLYSGFDPWNFTSMVFEASSYPTYAIAED
nr:hypothetical protein [Campylobacter concisus]